MNGSPKRSCNLSAFPRSKSWSWSIRSSWRRRRPGWVSPLVMKGLQPGIVHKTELGLVELNIPDSQAAKQSFERLRGKMNGAGSVLMQKQVRGDAELILGAIRDPQFGPCIMVGVGGVMAKLIDDTVFYRRPTGRKGSPRRHRAAAGPEPLRGISRRKAFGSPGPCLTDGHPGSDHVTLSPHRGNRRQSSPCLRQQRRCRGCNGCVEQPHSNSTAKRRITHERSPEGNKNGP